jgi:hypothetical protein
MPIRTSNATEERTVEELQARAAELEIEGRSMTRDELIKVPGGRR